MADLFSHPSEGVECAFDQSGWLGEGKGERGIRIKALRAQTPGVYRVYVDIQGSGALFGQRRNLISPSISGKTSFLSCLTEYIPSMDNQARPGDTLYASVSGGEITAMRAEPAQARRVFIAGDSTVADQFCSAEYYPMDSYCGWGQMLAAFLREDAVCNMAHSGLTGRCFIEDGHFDIVKRYMQPGDLCLIQFGHNDQKRRYLQADQQYPMYLERICREVMSKGGQPVLISPVSRVPGRDAAGVFDLLEAHAQAVRKLSDRLQVPFIDLHSTSFRLFCEMGDACRGLFMDMTHANDPGAFRLAGLIAGELERLGLARSTCPEPGYLQTDCVRAPGKAQAAPVLPMPYVDIDGVPDREILHRALQKGLLDPCVLHLHPFEPMSRAGFIQMLFRAAHLPTCATDGEKPYADVDAREFDASYAAACKKQGLVKGDYYRPDDMITADEVNELCERLGFSVRLKEEGLPTKYQLICLLVEIAEGYETCQDRSANTNDGHEAEGK